MADGEVHRRWGVLFGDAPEGCGCETKPAPFEGCTSATIKVKDRPIILRAFNLIEDEEIAIEMVAGPNGGTDYTPIKNVCGCKVTLSTCNCEVVLTRSGTYRLNRCICPTETTEPPINSDPYVEWEENCTGMPIVGDQDMSCGCRQDQVSVSTDADGCVTILVIPADGTPTSTRICPGDNVECEPTGIRINGTLCPFPDQTEVLFQDNGDCTGTLTINGTNHTVSTGQKVVPEQLHVPATIGSSDGSITTNGSGVDNQTLDVAINKGALVSGAADNALSVDATGCLFSQASTLTVNADGSVTHVSSSGTTVIPAPTITVDSDRRLDNPRIVGTNIVWDVIDTTAGNAVVGTETLDASTLINANDLSGQVTQATAAGTATNGTGFSVGDFIIEFPNGNTFAVSPNTVDTFGSAAPAAAAGTATNGVAYNIGDPLITFPNGSTWAGGRVVDNNDGTGTMTDAAGNAVDFLTDLCDLPAITDAQRDAATSVEAVGCVDGAQVRFNIPDAPAVDMSPIATVSAAANQTASAVDIVLGYGANPSCPTPGQTSGTYRVEDSTNTTVVGPTAATAGTVNVDLSAFTGPFTAFYTATDACGTSAEASSGSFAVDAGPPTAGQIQEIRSGALDINDATAALLSANLNGATSGTPLTAGELAAVRDGDLGTLAFSESGAAGDPFSFFLADFGTPALVSRWAVHPPTGGYGIFDASLITSPIIGFRNAVFGSNDGTTWTRVISPGDPGVTVTATTTNDPIIHEIDYTVATPVPYRYWVRVWNQTGDPEVINISELEIS